MSPTATCLHDPALLNRASCFEPTGLLFFSQGKTFSYYDQITGSQKHRTSMLELFVRQIQFP